MPSAVLTPFTRSAARRTGERQWRKRILPVGEIHYEGRNLRFDPGYLQTLAKSFADQAYDYVPFQLAGDSNKHTNDVERFGGRFTAMDYDPAGPDGAGLYVTLSANERGDKVLQENPQLGVSARIVEGYERADGQFYPGAIQHVLGTHDPRVTSLGGWRAVEASNDVQITVDLSSYQFAGDTEGTGVMPDFTADEQARLATLFKLPADKWQQFVDGLNAPELTDEDLAALLGDGGGSPKDELTDEELDELIQAAEVLDGQGELAGAGAGTQLSTEALMALELTNARADDTDRRLRDVQGHLDNERWLRERNRLVRDLSIPVRIVDKAKPLLLGSAHVVDLANGSRVDAGAIVRSLLEDVGAVNQALGLGMDVELGSAMDEPEQHGQAEQARHDTVARFRSQTGL
jgi:hypothetical protein